MLDRMLRAMSPAALVTSVLALVVAGAGIGWTAGQIGTKDLKNNAVTSAKVKDGSLKAADLVKEKKYTAATFGNGGEGDCLWLDFASEVPGLGRSGFRVDRFGTTHLRGLIGVQDGPGGDGACGSGGSDAEAIVDLTAFTLPKSARPATSVFRMVPDLGSSSSILVIPGPGGLEISPGVDLPFGAVMVLGGAGTTLFLDGVTFETKAAKVPVAVPRTATVGPHVKQLIRQYLGH